MRIAGRLMLIKIGDGASPESFTTVACQRGTSNSLQSESIDVSDKDTRWRQMVAGGSKGVSLSASGLIANAAAHRLLTNLSTQNAAYNFQIVFADGQTISGSFRVETWALSGEFNDAQQYELTLVSADDMTYSNAADLPVLLRTEYVNINAQNFKNAIAAGPTPGGTIITINALSDETLIIRKPSVAEDASMTWDAMSRYGSDGASPPGDGLTWFHGFKISNQADTEIYSRVTAASATASAAQAVMQALTPITLTGHTAYQFWSWDTPLGDNRGGLSLKVEIWQGL